MSKNNYFAQYILEINTIMFINLFQITFLNIYIISPKTWLHKIQSHNKISFIFVSLCLIPYVDYQYILIFIFLYSIIILNLKIHKQYTINLLNILFFVLIFSLDINSININTELYNNALIYIPIDIQIPYLLAQFFAKYFYINIWLQYYYLIIIPKFILRAILIIILHFVSLRILFLTTTYEDVILYYLMNYIKIDNSIIKQINLITALGYQFIALVINKINTIIVAVKLRNTQYVFSINQYNLCYFALKNLFIFIHNDVIRITSILYGREIEYNNL
uniref:hypothetical protein n=1 Tax=Anunuuluaehu liula TaxID=3049639 RepID=UPI0030023CB4